MLNILLYLCVLYTIFCEFHVECCPIVKWVFLLMLLSHFHVGQIIFVDICVTAKPSVVLASCVTRSSVMIILITQIAKTFGAILIKHKPDMKVSEWCLIKVHLRVFAIWVCTQITKFMGPTWGPPESCRPEMGPMLGPWNSLSGYVKHVLAFLWSSTMTKQHAIFGCWAVFEKKVHICVSLRQVTLVLKWDWNLICFHSKSIA